MGPITFSLMEGSERARAVMDLATYNARWIDREQAEEDETYRQVIPYVMLGYSEGGPEGDVSHIFTYRRLKGGGEKRLHDKWSIGLGGHIEEKDVLTANNPVWTAALRELDEEIEGEWTVVEKPIGTIYLHDNEVDRVHVGIIIAAKSPNPDVKVKEKKSMEGRMMSLNELARATKEGAMDFEPWSAYILEYLEI